MRKRSLIAAGLMILCVGLTACGGSKGTDNGSTTQQQSQNTSTGYVFTTNGVNIAIDEKLKILHQSLALQRVVIMKLRAVHLTEWTSSGIMTALHFRDIRKMA